MRVKMKEFGVFIGEDSGCTMLKVTMQLEAAREVQHLPFVDRKQ